MGVLSAPTKANLMKAKASYALAQKGFELLDKKRNVLIREMMDLVEKAKDIQEEIYKVIENAYDSLQNVNMTMGIQKVEEIAQSIPKSESFEVLLKSVMGVEIPEIKYTKEEIYPSYGLYSTNTAIDRATYCFRQARYMIYELAQIENSIFKLAKEIEKAQKRTNALQHIQIPKYKEQIKYIQEVLEEKEREDFFRLKRLKK